MSTEQNECKQENTDSEGFEQESGKRKRDDEEVPTENLSAAENDAIKKLKSEQDTADTSANVPSVVPTTSVLSNVSFPLAGAPTPIANIAATGAQETILIEISQEKVGQVIGSKGAIIQEIQMRTGAKAYVNQDFPDGVNRQVNLTGTALQVKAAAELVRLIIDQGPTAIHINSLTGGPTLTSVIECTQAQVGKVIGTSGAVIKDLQSKSGARIQIDQDFPPDVPRKINITGTATAVSLAASLVQSILNGTAASSMGIGGPFGGGGPSAYGGGGMMGSTPHQMQYGGGGGGGGEMKQTIDVPKSVVGKIIGKGGETITTIQRKSGSKVTVDQSVPEGMPCKVMMSGSAQGLAIASQLINEIMMGVPSGKIGAGLPMAPVGHQMGGMGMVNSPYGGYAQPAPSAYGMNTYGMPQQMQQQMSQYGGYYPQPQQQQMQQQQMQMQQQQQQHQQVQQQQQQQYAMAAVSGASGYQSYGAAAATPAMGGTGAGGGGYGAYAAPAAAAVAQKPISASSSVWTEHKTDDGITYWYNCSTGVSQWERPKSM